MTSLYHITQAADADPTRLLTHPENVHLTSLPLFVMQFLAQVTFNVETFISGILIF